MKRDAQDDPATLEWLQVATGRSEVALPLTQLLEKDMWRVSSTVIVQPHSVPGCVVALKVPPPPFPPTDILSIQCLLQAMKSLAPALVLEYSRLFGARGWGCYQLIGSAVCFRKRTTRSRYQLCGAGPNSSSSAAWRGVQQHGARDREAFALAGRRRRSGWRHRCGTGRRARNTCIRCCWAAALCATTRMGPWRATGGEGRVGCAAMPDAPSETRCLHAETERIKSLPAFVHTNMICTNCMSPEQTVTGAVHQPGHSPRSSLPYPLVFFASPTHQRHSPVRCSAVRVYAARSRCTSSSISRSA